MAWFGKIAGGFLGGMLGGPLGAVAGATLGHIFADSKQISPENRIEFTPHEKQQATYFVALFSLLGKMAKADGRVTREEGEHFRELLDKLALDSRQRQFAIQLFNQAKESTHTTQELAQQFADGARGKQELLESMIDMLLQIAAADNELHPAEEAMLKEVAQIFGIEQNRFLQLKQLYFKEADSSFYTTLGCTPSSSIDEIKSNYRELANKFHPDKIVSKGLPEEFVDFAKKKFQDIQTAYSEVRRERGF